MADPHSAEAVRAARAAQLEAASRMEEETYDAACYSPPRVEPSELELDAVVYEPQDDEAKIEFQVSDKILCLFSRFLIMLLVE